ncbi:DUF882 domain-containing protein [Arenibaculum pallidiluteum]|uniref:DUF882 domain-containing protein n=1 Tax=Arenibaculum pallidiluteum TaxID=2812559 RepID=UPI001A96859A|nr:DUF882 domain-containing protein [Arenibaculum pallidiluteum]
MDQDRAGDAPAIGRRRLLMLGAAALATAATLPAGEAEAAARTLPPRRLSFLNLHTGERLSAEYWSRGSYQKDALRAIERLLRDHRNDQVHPIDPRLLDLVHGLYAKIGRRDPLHVISGYRSPATNAMLHETTDGVANFSYHMRGMAIDIRMPGVDTRRIYRSALAMRRGGVGFYPRSNFVHVDVGPVRTW